MSFMLIGPKTRDCVPRIDFRDVEGILTCKYYCSRCKDFLNTVPKKYKNKKIACVRSEKES